MIENIGNVIAKLRNAAGLTQTELAEEVGIDQSYLSAIEKGRKRPSLDILEGVARVLKMHVSEIVSLSETNNTESDFDQDVDLLNKIGEHPFLPDWSKSIMVTALHEGLNYTYNRTHLTSSGIINEFESDLSKMRQRAAEVKETAQNYQPIAAHGGARALRNPENVKDIEAARQKLNRRKPKPPSEDSSES